MGVSDSGISTLNRVCLILNAFTESEQILTLTEISKRIQLAAALVFSPDVLGPRRAVLRARSTRRRRHERRSPRAGRRRHPCHLFEPRARARGAPV